MDRSKIKLGLWGCGQRTHALLKESLAQGRVKVTCCYDLNQALASEVAGKHDEQELGFRRFLDRLAAGQPPEISLHDGLWATLLPLMARQSAEAGKTLAFPSAIGCLHQGGKGVSPGKTRQRRQKE